MIPSSKIDIEAIKKLEVADEKEILQNIPELLEWLQDCNWPVFERVCNRLSSLDEKIEKEVLDVLNGGDVIWKANLVGHLLPKLRIEAQMKYISVLTNLLKNASSEAYEEGLVNYIEMQLSNIAKNT